MDLTRRRLLVGIGLYGAGLLIAGCTAGDRVSSKTGSGEEDKSGGEDETTATEDLMREHGVLRRALLVYAEAAPKLGGEEGSGVLKRLQRTAKLFRDFGENYHEKKLEEASIFPAVKKKGGAISELADILIKQHQRGREITDYILALTQGGRLDPGQAESLAKAMDAFVIMYQNHTAREDTILFPAWKQTLTPAEYDEMGDRFEEIEHQEFGEGGFEKAVREISDIEKGLGLWDLAQFTAPPPAQ